MRSLSIVWIATLLLFGLVGTYAQISYEPAPAKTASETPKNTDDHATTTDTKADTPPQTSATETTTDDIPTDSDPSTTAAEEVKPDTNTAADTAAPKTEDDTAKDTAPEETTTDASTNTEESSSTTADPEPLIAAPDPELTASSKHGPIPAIVDGREPWRYYASKAKLEQGKPRISIVLTEAGLSKRNTTNALNRLTKAVTFAFSPYAKDLPEWLETARKSGHEALIMVPMEPIDYPKNDPGRHTLLTTHSPAQILDRLHFIMSRGQGYVGVMNDMGSKFTANREAMKTFINDLQKRGLMYLDGRTTRFTVGAQMARDGGVPRAMNDRYLDNTIRPTDIDKYLSDLESVAKTYGAAVGIGRAYPITIDRIARWAETLAAKGIELVPITAVANRQPIR